MKTMLSRPVPLWIFLTLLFSSFWGNLGAQTLQTYLKNPALEADLLADKPISTLGSTLQDLTLLKSLPFSSAVNQELRSFNPSLGVETLFWLPGQPKDLDPKLRAALTSFSKMKGLTYWSVTRQRREVLFKESYRVLSEGQRTPLKDEPGALNAGSYGAFLLQTDNTFGENVYRAEVRVKGDYYELNLFNASKMHWGILPLVDPGNLKMKIIVQPLEDGVLFYGVSLVKTASLFGLERSKEDSFYNRLKALADWIRAQIS